MNKITYQKFTPSQLDYWSNFEITSEILNHYNVRSLESYLTNSNIKIDCKHTNSYAYIISKEAIKIYSPESLKYKFSWLGKKPSEYVFGMQQLDYDKNHAIITGGEKDVMSLRSLGYNAVCLNSESANLSKAIYTELYQNFDDVIVLYDNDDTGKEQANKLVKNYPDIINVTLPKVVQNVPYGKDVSDLIAKVDRATVVNIIDNLIVFASKIVEDLASENKSLSNPTNDKNLELIFKTQKVIAKKKSEIITFADPILTHNENPIIHPRTINVIQGKAGVHKSRLAQIFSSILIKQPQMSEHPIGFKKTLQTKFTVLYVDTERNWTDQLPFALQKLQTMAGYAIEDHPENFDYISLLDIKRNERLQSIRSYIELSRSKHSKNLIIVLDVLTDCLCSFNDASESMELIDILNSTINNHDVTFICVIHENPGIGSKARGHLGTEIMNKASTVIQCSVDKSDPNKLVKIGYLKCRSSSVHDPIYTRFHPEYGLELAGQDLIDEKYEANLRGASHYDITVFMANMLEEPQTKKDVQKAVMEEFDIKKTAFESRTKKIVSEKMKVNINVQDYYIEKYQEGRYSYFRRVIC